MSTLSIKEINELIASSSPNSLIRIPVAVPNGSGFITRYITKVNLFRLLGQAIEFITTPGNNTIFTFTDGVEVIYNQTTGSLVLSAGTLGVRNGSAIVAALKDDGTIQLGNSGFTIELEPEPLTQDETLFIRAQSGYLDCAPLATILSPTTGSTINLARATHRALFLELVGGIAALTVNLPADPTPGDRVSIFTLQAVTALTLGHADTIYAAATTLAANQSVRYLYVSGTVDGWIPY